MGSDVKSNARIVCKQEEVEAWSKDGDWATPYVRQSCIIRPPNTPAEYLGALAGGAPEDASSMQQALKKTTDKRTGIASLSHPASELIMLHRITDVANINYWMRC